MENSVCNFKPFTVTKIYTYTDFTDCLTNSDNAKKEMSVDCVALIVPDYTLFTSKVFEIFLISP